MFIFTRLLFFSPGILMLINTLLYCVFFYRHQQLTKLLSRYSNEPIHHKPRESHGKYKLHLAMKTRMMTLITRLSLHTSLYVFFCFYLNYVSFRTSFVLLDTVFSNPEWSCHPADSSHVRRLWGSNLRFALPLAGQKHLHTVPPHDDIPKV